MKIDVSKSDSDIKVFKSTRDAKFPTLKNGNCTLPTESFTMILNGSPGSGKSLFIENLIRNFYNTSGKHTVFSNISYFCPSASQDSYEDSFVGDLDDDSIYTELNTETLNEAYDKALETAAEGTKKKPLFSLIVIDDMASELRQGGRDGGVKKLLLKMLRNFRHANLSIIISVQGYLSLDPQHRNVVRNLVQFKTGSFPELEKIYLEWGSNMKKDTFINEFIPFIFDKPHSFLQIDRYKSFKMCKGFQALDIVEN